MYAIRGEMSNKIYYPHDALAETTAPCFVADLLHWRGNSCWCGRIGSSGSRIFWITRLVVEWNSANTDGMLLAAPIFSPFCDYRRTVDWFVERQCRVASVNGLSVLDR